MLYRCRFMFDTAPQMQCLKQHDCAATSVMFGSHLISHLKPAPHMGRGLCSPDAGLHRALQLKQLPLHLPQYLQVLCVNRSIQLRRQLLAAAVHCIKL